MSQANVALTFRVVDAFTDASWAPPSRWMDPEVELMGSPSVRLSVRVSRHLAGRLDESAGDV
jgi:hypothetical protein